MIRSSWGLAAVLVRLSVGTLWSIALIGLPDPAGATHLCRDEFGSCTTEAGDTLERSRELDATETTDLAAIVRMIEEAGRRAFPVAALVSRAGVAPRDADARSAALTSTVRVDRISDVLVSRRAVDALKDAIATLLTAHHRAQPLSEGVPREEARERLFRRGHPAVFERVVQVKFAGEDLAGRRRGRVGDARPDQAQNQDRPRRQRYESATSTFRQTVPII